ncbi:MAG: transcription termination/antitermination protein NusG [Planctomycetota bacterium]
MGIDHTGIDQRAGILSDRVPLAGRVVEIPAPEHADRAGVADPGAAIPGAARWHVIHTRSRQEKALARTLTAAGIEHFLPLIRCARFCGHRKRFVDEPLFACYLFLRGPKEATYLAVATKRVASVINVADQQRFVQELEQIRLALDSGADLSPYPYLEVGRRARVKGGPFQGIEGLIEKFPRPDRLVLQIEALGRATCLEIDAGLLEPVDWS